MRNDIIQFYPSGDNLLERSKGCYQYDFEGKEYIDFESGVWCANLGHSHERIVNVITAQSKISIHHGYRFRNRESELLSVELQKLIGYENGACFFLSSGSEAVNLSITIAQKLSGKSKVLKISNSYLSAYGTGQIKPENNLLQNIAFNDIEAIEKFDFRHVSALVLETGGASVEVVQFPDTEFVRKLVEKARAHNCLIIAEEVTTGFGRLGKWFGFQHYNIKPDMVVMGKALGNGYPISAVSIDVSVLNSLNSHVFIYGQSHQNDPLGCAIALEVISVFKDEKIIEHCVQIGQYFANRLLALKNSYPNLIKDVRAKGLMLALEFNELYDGELFQQKLFEQGFVFGFKRNTLRFLPPLVISKVEIEKLMVKMTMLLNEEYLS